MQITAYNIIIRVYQDILRPVSNTISVINITSVQILFSGIYITEVYFNFCFII